MTASWLSGDGQSGLLLVELSSSEEGGGGGTGCGARVEGRDRLGSLTVMTPRRGLRPPCRAPEGSAAANVNALRASLLVVGSWSVRGLPLTLSGAASQGRTWLRWLRMLASNDVLGRSCVLAASRMSAV
jgi:hypothetical protein